MARDPPPKAKRPKLKHDGAASGLATTRTGTRSTSAALDVRAESGPSAGTGSNNNDKVTANANSSQQDDPARPPLPQQQQSRAVVPPISMQLGLGLRPFWSMCACCSLSREERTGMHDADQSLLGALGAVAPRNNDDSSPAPSPQRNLILPGHNDGSTVENLIHLYISACHFYGCSDRINAGVLTTLRFSLPTLRASGSFHDADMLALCEILLPHCNSTLSYIRRLDFSIASKEGKLHGKRGFRSHGAFTLSKLLSESAHIEEVFLQRNSIGPYGSSAIFLAASTNPILRTLVMRRCSIGERGALAFAEHVCSSNISGLHEVDISVNGIGFKGCIAVETALSRREEGKKIECDLEGNLVFQEVMNCVTHGLGILLSVIAFFVLSHRVQDKSHRHIISCAVYSTSLLVLYTSSTLYHSFFALQVTRYVFEVLDKCAIYILIAGSYTPYLQIALSDKPIWSIYLLAFIWLCCIAGVSVEAFFPSWEHKSKFSLSMYLGMGWACMVCLPDLVEVIPSSTVNLLVLGGVGYTSGVPFFVRNNNLDHSIWHCFVLAGSIFHWCGVFIISGLSALT